MRATFAGVLVRLAVVYPFAYTFGWGLAGIWLASGLDWIARAIVLLIYYRRGRWKARGA
jgi:Na+-driven multidrug efflux pump